MTDLNAGGAAIAQKIATRPNEICNIFRIILKNLQFRSWHVILGQFANPANISEPRSS